MAMNTKKEYKLNYLTAKFYQKYNSTDYPEIENKDYRPYIVMLVKIEDNTFAIPFRTNVRHNNCYKFKNSTRQTDSITGLDYTKAVIVNDSTYIGLEARINDREYTELNDSYGFILSQFRSYVRGYIEFKNGKTSHYNIRRYRYTTLQYFHKELGIK